MADAQNERTNSQNRRRRPKRRGGQKPPEIEMEQRTPMQEPRRESASVDSFEPTASKPIVNHEAPVIRPDNIEPPTVRSEEYCTFHMANFSDGEPMQTRTNMTTLRHLQVDHFGEATLFCDCLHNGPHKWPPSMQRLETAVELDQFLADSTNDA